MNGSTGEWFRLLVGFKQEYLLSSILFNIFSTELCNTLKHHEEKVSTDGKAFTKVQFADDKDALAEVEQDLEAQ